MIKRAVLTSEAHRGSFCHGACNRIAAQASHVCNLSFLDTHCTTSRRLGDWKRNISPGPKSMWCRQRTTAQDPTKSRPNWSGPPTTARPASHLRSVGCYSTHKSRPPRWPTVRPSSPPSRPLPIMRGSVPSRMRSRSTPLPSTKRRRTPAPKRHHATSMTRRLAHRVEALEVKAEHARRRGAAALH